MVLLCCIQNFAYNLFDKFWIIPQVSCCHFLTALDYICWSNALPYAHVFLQIYVIIETVYVGTNCDVLNKHPLIFPFEIHIVPIFCTQYTIVSTTHVTVLEAKRSHTSISDIGQREKSQAISYTILFASLVNSATQTQVIISLPLSRKWSAAIYTVQRFWSSSWTD